MLYVGVDTHKEMSQIAVMDAQGVVVRQARVASTRAAVQGALLPYREPLKAVLEAGYGWGPMYDWLDEIADEVVLAHPTKVRAIAEARIKTDAIDAKTLADLLRADLIPEAHAPSAAIRAVKRVLRQRLFWVHVQTMLKNRIQSLLAQHELERPDVRDLFGREGLAWLQQVALPEPDGALLRDDVRFLAVLREQIVSTERLIRRLSQGDPAVGWLRSLPGIGAFFSVLIRFEVDDITRFETAKKFAAYTGLVPSTYSSGKRTVHGRLTKQGNKWLRWALIEAVSPAVHKSPALARYYEKIRARRGVKDARAATARKLAELIWTVWTEQRVYEVR